MVHPEDGALPGRPGADALAALLDGWVEGGRHHLPLKVQYEDTDMAGIVYHAQYLAFAERGRSAMIRLAGIDQGGLRREGRVFAVRRIGVDYLAPAALGDALEVRTGLAAIRGARMVLDQEVLGAGGAPKAALEVEVALLDGDRGPCRLPQAMRDRIAATIPPYDR